MVAVGAAPESSAAEIVEARAIATDIVAVAFADVAEAAAVPDAGEVVAVVELVAADAAAR